MAAVKNQYVYSANRKLLKTLAEEFAVYLGRDVELDLENEVLTIFALPRPKMRWCKGCEKEKPIKQFNKRVRWMKEILCRKCEVERRNNQTIVEDVSRP